MSEDQFTPSQLDRFWLEAKMKAEREVMTSYQRSRRTAETDKVNREVAERTRRYYYQYVGEPV